MVTGAAPRPQRIVGKPPPCPPCPALLFTPFTTTRQHWWTLQSSLNAFISTPPPPPPSPHLLLHPKSLGRLLTAHLTLAMADKSKAKQGKKGDAPAVTSSSADAVQVNVTFTLTFTAVIVPIPTPPCYVSDHRFTFSLLSSAPTTSPPIGLWSPLEPTPSPSTSLPESPPSPSSLPSSDCPTQLPPSSPSPSKVTWSHSVDAVIDRDLLLTFERGLVPLHLHQRRLFLSPPPSNPLPDDPSAAPKTSKAKAPPAPLTTKKPKGGDDGRPSLTHPALEDLPFVPYATLHLPLSPLLCPPHSTAFSAPDPPSSFALPPGLESLTCVLGTGGVSPIPAALLSSLLPVSVHLHSLTELTPYPLAPSPYRDVSLSLALPASASYPYPCTFPASAAPVPPALLTPQVLFLGLLPPALLASLASDAHTALLLHLRDRDDGRIPTPDELQADAELRQQAEAQAQKEEDARLKEEAKKATKATPALKSPKGAKKTEAAPAVTPDPAPAPVLEAVEAAEACQYDERSNVYGVARLPLHELFQAPYWVRGEVGARAVYPPEGVAMLPPAVRADGYREVAVGYTVRALAPMPRLDGLREGLKYGRVVAVMEESGGGDGWGEVYEEVLRCNAKACGAEEPLPASWDWLDGVLSPAEGDVPMAEAEKPVEAVKEAPGKTAKKSVKPDEKTAKEPTAVIPAALPTRPGEDHLTGAFITDGKLRWLILEGLAVIRPNTTALAAVQAKLIAMKKSEPRMRLLVDDGMAFPTRLYSGTPLSLLHLRLSAPLSSLVTKASALASSSASFLSLSKLSMLGKGVVVKTLQQAWEGRVMLEEAEVRQLHSLHGKKEKLDDIYGAALAQREREARRARKAKDAAEQPKEPIPVDSAPVPTATDASPLADPAPAADATASPAVVDAVPDSPAAAPLEATVVAEETAVTLSKPHPQSAPSAVPTLPPLTYSSPAEYRACLKALREACHADRDHHWTFHPDYLHSSIPRWEDAEEAERDARRRAKAKWTDPRGFILATRGNPHGTFSTPPLLSEGERRREREERRRQKRVEELVELRWAARVERQQRGREVGFLTQPSFPSLFDKAPMTSVHLTGEEEVRERRAQEEKEKADWREKLCVDDPAFRVLWRGQHHIDHRGEAGEAGRQRVGGGSGKLFGLEGLRKDPPMKAALKFERVGPGVAGQSLVVEPAPVSIAIEGEWGGGLAAVRFREEEKRPGQVEFIRCVLPHSPVYKRRMTEEKH